jgi:hypothetical protein
MVKIRRSTSVVCSSLDHVNMPAILSSSIPPNYYVYRLGIGLEQHRIAWNRHKTPFLGFSNNIDIF